MPSLESLRRSRNLELLLGVDVNNLEGVSYAFPIKIEKDKFSDMCIGYIEFDYNKQEINIKEFENCDRNCDKPNCYKKQQSGQTQFITKEMNGLMKDNSGAKII